MATFDKAEGIEGFCQTLFFSDLEINMVQIVRLLYDDLRSGEIKTESAITQLSFSQTHTHTNSTHTHAHPHHTNMALHGNICLRTLATSQDETGSGHNVTKGEKRESDRPLFGRYKTP